MAVSGEAGNGHPEYACGLKSRMFQAEACGFFCGIPLCLARRRRRAGAAFHPMVRSCRRFPCSLKSKTFTNKTDKFLKKEKISLFLLHFLLF